MIKVLVISLALIGCNKNSDNRDSNQLDPTSESRCLSRNFEYEIKEDVVCKNGNLVSENPQDFELLDSYYGIDHREKKVYYLGREIPGVDVASFEIIVPRYSKDKDRIYLDSKVFEKADRATFQYIGGQLSKDKNHVFYLSSVLDDAKADSFEEVKPLKEDAVIDFTFYKDSGSVFFGNGRNLANSDLIGEQIDGNSFTFYGGPFIGVNGSIYIIFTKSEILDQSSFEFLGCSYETIQDPIEKFSIENPALVSPSYRSPPSVAVYCYGLNNGDVFEEMLYM